jgi:hypothetical protein
MNEPTPTPIWQDKNFISVLLVPLVTLVAKKLGINLNVGEVVAFAATVIGFVASAKWKGAKMAEAAAASTAAQASILNEQNKGKQLELAKQAIAEVTGAKVVDLGSH